MPVVDQIDFIRNGLFRDWCRSRARAFGPLHSEAIV